MDLKKLVCESVDSSIISGQDLYNALGISQEAKNGDICLPCFKLSKLLRKSPIAIADEIAKSVKVGGIIEKPLRASMRCAMT